MSPAAALDDLFALYAAPAASRMYDEDVSELEHALDPSVWGAAGELSSIYLYVQGRLVRAHVAPDRPARAECRDAMDPRRAAWNEAWQQLSMGVPGGAGVAAARVGAARVGAADAVGGSAGAPADPSVRVPLDIAG